MTKLKATILAVFIATLIFFTYLISQYFTDRKYYKLSNQLEYSKIEKFTRNIMDDHVKDRLQYYIFNSDGEVDCDEYFKYENQKLQCYEVNLNENPTNYRKILPNFSKKIGIRLLETYDENNFIDIHHIDQNKKIISVLSRDLGELVEIEEKYLFLPFFTYTDFVYTNFDAEKSETPCRNCHCLYDRLVRFVPYISPKWDFLDELIDGEGKKEGWICVRLMLRTIEIESIYIDDLYEGLAQ